MNLVKILKFQVIYIGECNYPGNTNLRNVLSSEHRAKLHNFVKYAHTDKHAQLVSTFAHEIMVRDWSCRHEIFYRNGVPEEACLTQHDNEADTNTKD